MFIITLLPGVSLLTQNDDYTKYTSSLGAFSLSLSRSVRFIICFVVFPFPTRREYKGRKYKMVGGKG